MKWKRLERTTATKLGGYRFPRWLDFRQSAPDVVVDDFPELVIDAKSRKRWAHHTYMEAIQDKYCKSRDDVPMLVTKHDGQRGEYVTIPLDYFAKMLNTIRETRQ
jgi:hypothetical protein